MSHPWPESTITELAALAAKGYSASQAAAQIPGMTRNGAVGIAFRRKFHFHGAHGGGGPHHKAKPKPNEPMFIPKRINPKAPIEAQVAVDAVTRPTMALVTIEQLQSWQCKWIMGDVRDPNHRYCGTAQLEGKPYCPFHCRISYETPEQRRANDARRQEGTNSGTNNPVRMR